METSTILWGLLVFYLILVIWWLSSRKITGTCQQCAEKFNPTFSQSMTEKDMDTIKDGKGRTLDDDILYQATITGGHIVPPRTMTPYIKGRM